MKTQYNSLFVILILSSLCYSKLVSKIHATTVIQQDNLARVAALEAKINLLSGQNTYKSLMVDGVNLLNYMYKDALIYQDIFNAYQSNILSKKGSPVGWNDSSYSTTPWNLRRILNIGAGAQSNGNGILVKIPAGYNVMWLRILNDRWATFRVSPFSQDSPTDFSDWTEVYAGGYRNLNEISPDGAAPDSQWNLHTWMPIPLRAAGSYMVYSDRNGDSWISGIAFGKNLWNHAKNSGVAYYWKLNGGGDIGWGGENWNNDHLAYFKLGTVTEVFVPVIFTGKDKIIYIVEHNNNWTGTQHGNVYINGQQVERFRTSYNNPFAVHYNSKMYTRYMATRIPAALIAQGDKFVTLKIDLTMANQQLHFREIGTHDYF